MKGFSPQQNRHGERGNVLWFILIAIVLLGALTVLLNRSGTSVDQSGDVEQARVKSSQVLRYAKSVETAVQQMVLRGISESDISFESQKTTADYTNPNCTVNDCRVFETAGGGIPFLLPPSGVNDGSEWIFTGANNVGTAAKPVGTTAARTGNDLVMLLANANNALCLQLNRDMNVGTGGTLPEDSTGIATTIFTGTYDNVLSVIDGDPTPFELDGKTAGCFIDTNADPDVTYFYFVLLAR
jgi:hypothetical protein